MATTQPKVWTGEPVLTDDKVDTIYEWYVRALGDEDKASTLEEECFYEGWRAACEAVLTLLRGEAEE